MLRGPGKIYLFSLYFLAILLDFYTLLCVKKHGELALYF